MVSAVTAPSVTVDAAVVQRRTLRLLFVTQMLGGIGIAIGLSVGALLAADMAGVRVSGLAQSSFVVGGALLTVPLARLMQARGRRPGLSLAFLLGAIGAVGVVAAAAMRSVPLLFAALFLFGGANTANYQARYAAVDLADPGRRARQLSFVIWATTIGAVAGPNLAPAAERVLDLPRYSAPFAFSALAFGVAGVALVLFLRPDPLLTARTTFGVSAPTASGAGLRAAWREVVASPAARLGMAAVAMGHLVMVGVMSMTPVHIGETHDADVLTIVGVVLSLHIAGMYAFSPVTGWLTDRFGRRPVILGGVALLLVACAVAGTSGHDTPRLAIGLALLGMGWSGTMVAGSTLLSESVGLANKPAVQGLSDLVMGLAGAGAGALSGVVVAWSGYATLTALAAIATVPLVALALRPVRVLAGGS
ncbi:MAG TPA: MFS transporter [Micromonosporaceae bacterium]|jgi:MFS family permease